MSKIKHICVITYGYPTGKKPYSYTFVDKLVRSISDQKIKCTVINPMPINNKIKDKETTFEVYETENGNKVEVFRPAYPYFYAKRIGRFNTGKLTLKCFEKAVIRTIKKFNILPDCLYAHFIFPAGAAAANIGKKMNLPVFFAYGESSPWGIKILGEEYLRSCLDQIRGVVAVSTAKKEELSKYGLVNDKIIEVFPNAIDNKYFKVMDKQDMRKKYKFSSSDFIVGYVGTFNESKGVKRVLKATENCKEVKLVLIGGGSINPCGDNIIFKGRLPHQEVAQMLNACDIFVLPTKNEGCCNAIVEAMACGLPIISSDEGFNYDIISNKTSLLIDPDNIEEIEGAIIKLRNSKELRERLRNESIEGAKKLNINDRAKKILEWMSNNISN